MVPLKATNVGSCPPLTESLHEEASARDKVSITQRNKVLDYAEWCIVEALPDLIGQIEDLPRCCL
jgi:hypothetical protein